MTYILGIKREMPRTREAAKILADGYRALSERRASYATTLDLSPEQRKMLEIEAAVTRLRAGLYAKRAKGYRRPA